jgi:hypothetical protein
MPRRERYASRTARAMSHTPAAMGANARQTRLPAASRRQLQRLTAWRKRILIRTANQPRSQPVRAQQARLPTSTPRLKPRRAARALRTHQRSGLEGSAQQLQPHPAAERRKHNVRREASHARPLPTEGLRKPSTMRHPRVLLAPLPAPRQFEVPVATADSLFSAAKV